MSRCHAILPESLRRLRGRVGLGSRFLQAERSPVPARSWRTCCGGSCGCWTRTPPPSCWSSRHGRMCWSWWAAGASACNCGGLYSKGSSAVSTAQVSSDFAAAAAALRTQRACANRPPARTPPPALSLQVAHALTANRVPHLYPRDAKRFDAAITQFKQPLEEAQPGDRCGCGGRCSCGCRQCGCRGRCAVAVAGGAGRGDGGRAGGGSTAAQRIVRQHCCDACITRIRAVKELHAAGLFSVTSCPPVMLHALYSSSQTRMACSCLQRCRRAEQRRSATAAAAGTAAAGQAGRQRAQLD